MRLGIIIGMVVFTAINSLGMQAASSGEFVTIYCDSPGGLELTEEARTAPRLKVVGDINQIDFVTLKQATLHVTRVLDLSEATIHEVAVEVSDDSDWMVGGSTHTVIFPANTLPKEAFIENLDNTVTKFVRGSESLTKLILPANLTGFMEGSLTNNYVLADLEVPENSTTLRKEGKLIYSYDGSVLHAMPPAYYGDVTVASGVTTIAPGVFSGMSPASVTFTSASVPSFGEGNKIDAAYIMADDVSGYKELFPDVDCISSMEQINIVAPAPGQLLTVLGNMGYSRSEVRSIAVSGEISYEDFTQLVGLPNLHHADLSQARVAFSGQRDYIFSNTAVTAFKFPLFDGPLALEIAASSRLNGHLDVPEGVWWFASSSRRFTSAELPSSIQMIDNALFSSYSVMESIDFSACYQLQELKCLSSAGRLTEVRLPDGLKRLYGIGGPVTTMDLPNSIEYIDSPGGWLMEKLVLPLSLTQIYLGSLPETKQIDASSAGKLTAFRGLYNVPCLKTLDLSMCPVKTLDILSGDMLVPQFANSLNMDHQRIVITGNTKYPAPKVVAVEDMRVPSTLVNLSGLSKCRNLKTLDLMGCFRLRNISGISDCPALETLKLPDTELTIYGLDRCGNLKTIYCASSVAPAYNCNADCPLDFSQVTLNVCVGSAGAYRMSEYWEKCKEIREVGYRVTIEDNIASLQNYDKSILILDGAGIYDQGSEIVLYAMPYGISSCAGWSVNGNRIESNPCSVKADRNITAVPIYSLDGESFDVVMTVEVPVAQTLRLEVRSFEHVVAVDDRTYGQYTGSSWAERQYPIYLQPGEHEIAINGNWLCIGFDDSEDGLGEDQILSVTSFKINNRDAIRQLYPQYFDMDVLDLSGCSEIHYLSDFGKNRFSVLDVSNCPQLDEISCYDCGIETFLFDGAPLRNIFLPKNKLTKLDLTALKDLVGLDLSYNSLVEFEMDAPSCESLDLGYNPMAFSTLTPQIYNIYMTDMYTQGKDRYEVHFIIDTSTVNSNGRIDLSSVMTPPGCVMPTAVYINGCEVSDEAGDGVYTVPYGYSQVVLTNDAFPHLCYVGSVVSEYDSGVGGVTADDQHCDIYSFSGELLRKGVPVSDIEDLPKGMYIICQGTKRFKLIK